MGWGVYGCGYGWVYEWGMSGYMGGYVDGYEEVCNKSSGSNWLRYSNGWCCMGLWTVCW